MMDNPVALFGYIRAGPVLHTNTTDITKGLERKYVKANRGKARSRPNKSMALPRCAVRCGGSLSSRSGGPALPGLLNVHSMAMRVQHAVRSARLRAG